MIKIATKGDLDDLMERIKGGNAHFIGYETPYAMIAEGTVMYEAPIGHLIPALMDALGQGHYGVQQDVHEPSA